MISYCFWNEVIYLSENNYRTNGSRSMHWRYLPVAFFVLGFFFLGLVEYMKMSVRKKTLPAICTYPSTNTCPELSRYQQKKQSTKKHQY